MNSALVVAVAISTSLADPPETSPLVAVVEWLTGVALGSVATSIALIAVASVGLMMLAGRIPIRRGGLVILGCFVLFGAETIARGLQNASSYAAEPDAPTTTQEPPPSPLASPLPQPQNYDPYAGAAVPMR